MSESKNKIDKIMRSIREDVIENIVFFSRIKRIEKKLKELKKQPLYFEFTIEFDVINETDDNISKNYGNDSDFKILNINRENDKRAALEGKTAKELEKLSEAIGYKMHYKAILNMLHEPFYAGFIFMETL